MSSEKDIFDPSKEYPNTLRFMENAVLGFLQALFGSFPAGNNPKLYHYDNNPELTEIMIEGRRTDNLATVDTRPKIVVARGPVSWNKTHIGNFIGNRTTNLANKDYASIYSGSVGVSCFSREDLEADHLAQICFDLIEAFQFKLHKYGFLTINSAQIGQCGLIKGDSKADLSVTPVLIKVQVSKQWTTKIVDPILLQKILVNLESSPAPNLGQSLEV